MLVLCLLELLCGMLGFFHREVVTESMQEELYNGIQHLKFVNDSKAHEGAFWAWETVQYQVQSFLWSTLKVVSMTLTNFIPAGLLRSEELRGLVQQHPVAWSRLCASLLLPAAVPAHCWYL